MIASISDSLSEDDTELERSARDCRLHIAVPWRETIAGRSSIPGCGVGVGVGVSVAVDVAVSVAVSSIVAVSVAVAVDVTVPSLDPSPPIHPARSPRPPASSNSRRRTAFRLELSTTLTMIAYETYIYRRNYWSC
jgi:hypothetical protein